MSSNESLGIVALNDDVVPVTSIPEPPEVGMVFETFNEAKTYYCKYADSMGFASKIRHSHYDNKILTRATLTCVKEGNAPEKPCDLQYKDRLYCRTQCQARMRIAGNDLIGYMVKEVELKHNHEFIEAKKMRYLRSKREISAAKRCRIETNDLAGIGASKTMHSFAMEAGGYSNLTFTERDVSDILKDVRNLRLGVGDAEAILHYFLKMREKDPNFFYLMDLDKEGRLRNIFWVDGRSRAAYQYFGDVICFDTTYLTNKYDMPFAPFVGVNHHLQSVLLGCGLLCSETTENYIWLFKSWLTCMRGVPPPAIITDQSRAIMGAVKEVFPESKHRLCIWHILQKVPQKLPKGPQAQRLRQLVFGCLSVESFEEGWKKYLVEFRMEENSWLKSLYDIRHLWVPAFVRGTFWAGMQSTQRSESMHAFFDGYLNSKTSLKQFVHQFELALQNKYEKEEHADFDSAHRQVQIVSQFKFEHQLSLVYIVAAFKKFQVEIGNALYCDIICTDVFSCLVVYEVEELLRFDGMDWKTEKHYKVFWDEHNGLVNCSRRMFEQDGLLCRHCLVVLKRRKIEEIPSAYILDRWRKDIRRSYNTHARVVKVDSLDAMGRQEDFLARCVPLGEEAFASVERYEQLVRYVEAIRKKFSSIPKVVNLNEGSSSNKKAPEFPCVESVPTVIDPHQARMVGRPPTNCKISLQEKINVQYKKRYTKEKKSKETNVIKPPPSDDDMVFLDLTY